MDEAQITNRLMTLWGGTGQDATLEVADMAAAGRIRGRMHQLRTGAGDRVAGRKIGFSNRTLWPLYGVDGPIWNYVWDSTVIEAEAGVAEIPLHALPEPRIEPEIVLHLARAPEPGMTEADLMGCIDRIAHGCEIVVSVFPEWRFSAAGATAAYGLHGRLVVGPWFDTHRNPQALASQLSDFGVALRRDGALLDSGHARNVLGGPLSALRHLVEALAQEPDPAPLQAGEIISTGTLTDAHPVQPGTVWTTEFQGISLPGLEIRFT